MRHSLMNGGCAAALATFMMEGNRNEDCNGGTNEAD